MNTTVNPAEEIAQAVLKELEGDGLLIEAMARALARVYQPDKDPDTLYDWEGTGKEMPFWKGWEREARARLVCDRIMRGPGDKMAYERMVKQYDIPIATMEIPQEGWKPKEVLVDGS